MSREKYLKGFKWSGPKYRRAALPENSWPTRLFDDGPSLEGKRVVQVGSGGRELTARIAERATFTLGIEFDQERFTESLRDDRFRDKEKVRFFRADPCAIPSNVPGAPFDLLVAHVPVERCQNLTRLFSRLIRMVDQGGEVYLEMAARDDCADLLALIEEVAKRPPFASYMTAFRYPYQRPSPEAIALLLTETGYAEQRLEQREETIVIAADLFPQWLATYAAAPWVDALPEGRRDSFTQEVAVAWPRQGEEVTVTRSVIAVGGKRLWGDLSGDLFPDGPPPGL